MSEVTADKIFEIIGVYFANCYWNNLYALAQESYKEGDYQSLVEAYKGTIEKYSKAFCKSNDETEKINKHYVRIIKDLYINYRDFLKTNDSLIEFIDKVSKFLLPAEHYKTLTSRDPKKDAIFKNILIKSVMKFTIQITQDEIQTVINEQFRTDKTYVINWKNKFVKILTQEKDEFCMVLMAQTTGINIQKEDSPKLAKEIYDKLQEKIKNLLYEKSDLIKEINNHVKYIDVLKKIIKEKEDVINELEENLQKKEAIAPHITKTNNILKSFSAIKSLNNSTVKSATTPKKILQPIVEVNTNNKALEKLKKEEFSGDEFEPLAKVSDNIQVLDKYKLDADD